MADLVTISEHFAAVFGAVLNIVFRYVMTLI